MLWLHQARALEILEKGTNTVIATPTASGKSLIFQLHCLSKAQAEPKATALAFYPVKALANDQMRRWNEAVAQAGLEKSLKIGQIDGDVKPMSARERILRECRIVVMTPDVCHAWLTRTATKGATREFLSQLKTVVLDEAHTYEFALGSNAAYMLRRLTSAAMNAGSQSPPQFIASTATIQDPGGHLYSLTGLPFQEVGPELSGAPRQQREVHHLEGKGEEDLTRTIISIIDNDPDAQVIAFHDSRQGVERVVQNTNQLGEVMPYRSGYLGEDRRRIENALRDNKLPAVVSTSALELGIDMPDLNYGLNLGLPESRKSFQQRMGRIGRNRPATFVILAEEAQFTGFGDTLEQYCLNSVEESRVYLENEYISFQQALCLRSELRAAGTDSHAPPQGCDWPPKFSESLQRAHGRPPPHLDETARSSARNAPQIAYPLRNCGEAQLALVTKEQDSSIGSIEMGNALREAYPGATYRHRGQSYQVAAWKRRRDDRSPYVVLEPSSGSSRRNTYPLMRRVVTVRIPERAKEEHRCRVNAAGITAALHVNINESVEGYEDEYGQHQYYRNLQELDPRKSRKQRSFPTTAVLIQMNDPELTGESGTPWQARHQIASFLAKHLSYDRSISLREINTAVDNVFTEKDEGFQLNDRAVIIYDGIVGGMGLTSTLYQDLARYAANMHRNQGPREIPIQEASGLLARWVQQHLGDLKEGSEDQTDNPQECWWRVICPSTKVQTYSEDKEEMVEGTISGQLWQNGVIYTVETQDETLKAREKQVQALGQDLDWQIWQPSKGILKDLMAEE